MCANYLPVSEQARLLTFFGVEYTSEGSPQDVFALGHAPFIRLDSKFKDKLSGPCFGRSFHVAAVARRLLRQPEWRPSLVELGHRPAHPASFAS
jgi:hypothetical protein